MVRQQNSISHRLARFGPLTWEFLARLFISRHLVSIVLATIVSTVTESGGGEEDR